jgi:hypothetical protein
VDLFMHGFSTLFRTRKERDPMANDPQNTGGRTSHGCSAVRLELGRIVATPGALTALSRAGQRAADFLIRHQRSDWGDVGPDDAAANDRASAAGDERVLSAYRLRTGVRIWVITEADRSATTVLLPDEY